MTGPGPSRDDPTPAAAGRERRLPEDRRPAPEIQGLPAELHRFVELFNEHAFWDSHEVLEGPWRESGSGFYHGLILYASAFVHLQRENPHGIVAQLRKAEGALAPYTPCWLGVDVTGILERCGAVAARVEARRDSPPALWRDEIPFPRIELAAHRVRGDEAELEAG